MKFSIEEGRQIYENANKFLIDNWPGYVPSQGCLYEENGDAYIYTINGEDIITKSNELNLYGSTCKMIDEVLTAIVDITIIDSIDEITAVLVHELFHIHQLNNWKKISFPNPEFLITYPIEIDNEKFRANENVILVEIHKNKSRLLNEFLNVRTQRKEIVEKEYLDYERSIETFEGCAYYLENEYLRSRNKTKCFPERIFNEIKLKNLASNSYRIQYLAKGALLADALSIYNSDWKSLVETNQLTLEEVAFESVDFSSKSHINFLYDEHIKKMVEDKKSNDIKKLNNYLDNNKIIEIRFQTPPEIRSLDPMNMEGLSDKLILHNNNFQVGKGEYSLMINGRAILSKFKESIWEIENVILSNVDLECKKGEILEFSDNGLYINWLISNVKYNTDGRMLLYFT